MKKIFYLISMAFILFLSSCEKSDLNDETGIKFAIDKDNVEPPGGQQGSAEDEGILNKIDKENVETPGGQGSD
ncbi:hypothetical protein [Aquimarina algicola]|uniref:Uncharacterized protein n=1 Tax=Aquimarina algicola TaxID=2589995 RepID=A0A504JK13_9FLAO|nr:hypothetical protein [Aquimarina algicola]TPN87089.1 hypothetical protein FHK87_05725 [Aquimarina algicola]